MLVVATFVLLYSTQRLTAEFRLEILKMLSLHTKSKSIPSTSLHTRMISSSAILYTHYTSS